MSNNNYAVIGNPIGHSKSPMIHALFAEQTQQHLRYSALLAPLDGFSQVVQAFRLGGGLGVNVTVPFKLDACNLSHELSERAKLAQAVNTLKFEPNSNIIFGDNTDGVGLVRDIRFNLNYAIQGKRILIMGAGGASRGVIYPLFQENPESITIVNRTLEKANELCEQFKSYGIINALDYKQLSQVSHERFDIVINATSSGLTNEMPQLPTGLFYPNALAYDMMYGKQTAFLQFASSQQVETISDGLGMLVEQAGESFHIWRNIRPDTQAVIKKLKQIL